MFNFFRIAFLICLALFSKALIAEVIDGENFVDPTAPLTSEVIEEENLDIAAIFRTIRPESFELSFVRVSNINPIAVINDQRVTLGDMVGGAIVSEITRSSVTLLIGEQEEKIGLYDQVVKRAVGSPKAKEEF